MSMLLALGLSASMALSPAQAAPSQLDKACRQLVRTPFEAPGPAARFEGGALLTAIASSENPQLLRSQLAGTDPNRQLEPYGTTALAHAVGAGNWLAIDLLLKAGADPNRPTRDGELPLERALLWLRADLACHLLAHGARLPSPGAANAQHD